MKFELTFLRGQVARRIVFLFVVAALIPIAATALLTSSQVTRSLTDISDTALREHAKNYGQVLYERLAVADAMLLEIASTIANSPVIPAESSRGQRFVSIGILLPNGERLTVFGHPEYENTMPGPNVMSDTSDSFLSFSTDESGQHQAYLSRLVELADKGQGQLVAELRLDALWGHKESYPSGVDFCVFDPTSGIVRCSGRVPDTTTLELKRGLADSPSGKLGWSHDDEDFVASYWTLFLGAHFNGNDLTIVASRPAADALSPVRSFNAIVPPVLLLSVVVVALLSVSQIRRIMVPLEKLIHGTRQIANRDFSSPVVVASGDEFEELAQSMNQMAARLGEQFKTLSTLSEVDRQILTSLDVDEVFETVLKGVMTLVPCNGVALTMADSDSSEIGRTFYVSEPEQTGVNIERSRIEAQDEALLLANRSGFYLPGTTTPKPYLKCLRGEETRWYFALPVISKGAVLGVIGFGLSDNRSLDEDKLMQIRDFSDRIAVAVSAVQREEKLYRQAHFDELTGLPSRQLFRDRLSQSLAQARREAHSGALLFIDLDRFKNVNDSMGHGAGDRLLKAAAERLQNRAREVDTVARLGGDEFTVILPQISSPSEADLVACDILEAFREPFEIDNNQHIVTASIGVTIFPGDGDTTEDLLRNADTAMYRAKEGGRGQRVFFEEEMNATAQKRMQMEIDLRRAFERRELALHYQPQIEISGGQVVGAEALLRWRHPELGWVSPSVFVPLAEDTGLICALGEWVLETSCDQYASWRTEHVAPARIAVNISAHQIHQPGFVDSVRRMLKAKNMPPDALEFEITESLLIDQVEKAIAVLDSLTDMGIRLSIDDFGTGYASLSYLKRFEFDSLKIDQAFMRDVPDDPVACALAQAIIAMAHSLDKTVIAEGVETSEQLAFLRDNGCEIAQGYYFSHPLPTNEFTRMLRKLSSADSSQSAAIV